MKRTREQIIAMHDYLKRTQSLLSQMRCKSPRDEGYELLISVIQEIHEDRPESVEEIEYVNRKHFLIKCSVEESENAHLIYDAIIKKGHYFSVEYVSKKNFLKVKMVSESKFMEYIKNAPSYFHNK